MIKNDWSCAPSPECVVAHTETPFTFIPVWTKISSLARIAPLHSAVRTCCKYRLHKHELVAILSESQVPCLASELLATSARSGLCTLVRRLWYFAPLCYVLRDCCNWTVELQQSESFRPSFGSRLHTFGSRLHTFGSRLHTSPLRCFVSSDADEHW